ncbi:winged helix-turn-helix transcriptional regulator [Halorubellus sp. PRR65]|uniref:winged helix-turn-helix transcriptional regulator n=1 Tax=Halorubellus sp. PRR65 TaxID=3098148 RepID=UPI002B25D802|nr:winged helix-turn-helix transcriptional regulator [Halorubellus sp. PRR65]
MTSDEAETPADDDEPSTRRQQAVDGFDSGIVDLLSWVLDTETRAKIYIFLQANPASTSEEIAQGTGLYPSTVREALAELHDEEKVHREKRAASGAGNNPYEYTAIAPSELVSGVVGQVQDELNTVFNLESLLDDEDELEPATTDDEPVTITVQADAVDTDGDATSAEEEATTDDVAGEDDTTSSEE